MKDKKLLFVNFFASHFSLLALRIFEPIDDINHFKIVANAEAVLYQNPSVKYQLTLQYKSVEVGIFFWN